MKMQTAVSRAGTTWLRVAISVAAIVSLLMLFFAVFSEIEVVRFLGAFWATILFVEVISLVLYHRARSRPPTR